MKTISIKESNIMTVIRVNIELLRFQVWQHIKRDNMKKFNMIVTNAITEQECLKKSYKFKA